RTGTLSSDAGPPLFRPEDAEASRDAATSFAACVLDMRLPLLRRLHRILQLLPDFSHPSVRALESGSLRRVHREPGDVNRRVPLRRETNLLAQRRVHAALCGRRTVRPLRRLLRGGVRADAGDRIACGRLRPTLLGWCVLARSA